MKKRMKLMYFYAYWDNNFELKDLFYDECKKNKVNFESVDVETEDGLRLSTKFGVKLCPYVILFGKNGREIKRGVANEVFEQGVFNEGTK